jgi:hypothetical protein
MTCSNWAGFTLTMGLAGSNTISVRTSERAIMADDICSASPTIEFIDRSTTSRGVLDVIALMSATVRPALRAISLIRSTDFRAASMSGLSLSSQRSAASTLEMIDASGWFTSCTIDPASSPNQARRS